jgi:hypothetical protein
MAEKCDTPDCLRGVDAIGQLCLPCENGLPPMKNPKSPHAWNHQNGTQKKPKLRIVPPTNITTGIKNPQKKPKLRIVHDGQNKPKTDPIIDKTLQRKAVQLIFSAYWYGWKDGLPDEFEEIFKDYGTFATGREVASKMVGTPDKHTSHINMKGNPSFAFIVDFLYPAEGERRTFEHIERSPVIMEALGGVSAVDAIELIKSDKSNPMKPFTFTKKNEQTYTWIDDSNITREIPTWAIA